MADLPIGDNAAKQLLSYIERIERLREEKKGIADDEKDVFAEAKSSGYDTKIMRRVLTERKKEFQKRSEEQAIFDTYANALGLMY